MKIYRLYVFMLVFILTSCEEIFVDKASVFKVAVFNRSSNDVQNVTLYLHEKKAYGTDSNKIVIETFASLKTKDSISIRDFDLKKYSKGQGGNICLEINKKGQIHQIAAWGYNDYNYADNSYPGYNAFEFYVFDKDEQYRELLKSFNRYRGSKWIEGGKDKFKR